MEVLIEKLKNVLPNATVRLEEITQDLNPPEFYIYPIDQVRTRGLGAQMMLREHYFIAFIGSEEDVETVKTAFIDEPWKYLGDKHIHDLTITYRKDALIIKFDTTSYNLYEQPKNTNMKEVEFSAERIERTRG